MKKLTDLPNIGKELEKQLNAVGIYSKEDLENIGSQEAWLKIQKIDASACINRLMGLEGAIQSIRWHDLSQKDKQRLQDFYQDNKKPGNKC